MKDANPNKLKEKKKMSPKAQTLTFIALSTAITCIIGPLSIPNNLYICSCRSELSWIKYTAITKEAILFTIFMDFIFNDSINKNKHTDWIIIKGFSYSKIRECILLANSLKIPP